MEKKKLLLVAVSVGFFLVLVMGTAILIVSPRDSPSQTVSADPVLPATSAIEENPPLPAFPEGQPELVNQLGQIPSGQINQPGQVNQPTQINVPVPEGQADGSPSGVPIYIYGENPVQSAPAASSPAARAPAGSVTTITVPPPPIPVPDASPVRRPSPAAPSQPRAVSPAQTSSTRSSASPTPAAPAPASSSSRSAVPASTTAKPAASSQAKVRYNYWVQVGAFSRQDHAEVVKKILEEDKGIRPVVVNREEIKGQIFYQVRSGPYVSSEDAAYWLALVKEVPGFEESQVRRSPAGL